MKNHFVKTLTTRCIAQNRKNMYFPTCRNLSVTPLLHSTPQPQTSTSLEIPSTTPPTKKKGWTALWFLVGAITSVIGERLSFRARNMYFENLEYRRKCLEMKPMKLNGKARDWFGYQRFVCKGVFEMEKTIYVGPKPRSMAKGSEIGYFVITPLLPIPNEPYSMESPILVNRGWIPLDWEEKSLEPIDNHIVVATASESRKANNLLSSQLNPFSKFWYKLKTPVNLEDQDSAKMHVEVVGLVMNNVAPRMNSLIHSPGSFAWFFLDVPKFAQAMGFGEYTIYIEQTHNDMEESSPYPVPRDVEDIIRYKDLPPDLTQLQLGIAYWLLIPMACFAKVKSNIFGKTEYIVNPPRYMKMGSLVLAIISWAAYKFHGLFRVIDTIGVGCVTKLDQHQNDQVNDNIDLIRDLF